MIIYKPEHKLLRDTKQLIDFFNVLEEQLKNCLSDEDYRKMLDEAETELIMWGKVWIKHIE